MDIINYIKTEKYNATITDIVGTKVYLDSLPVRYYPNKLIEYYYNNNKFTGQIFIETDSNFDQRYFIDTITTPLSLIVGNIIDIYDTKPILKLEQLPTIQDIVDNLNNDNIGEFIGTNSKIRHSKIGNFSLLDSIGRKKISELPISVKSEQQLSIDNNLQTILSIKENSYSNIILFNQTLGFIEFKVDFDKENKGFNVDIVKNHFVDDGLLTINFEVEKYTTGITVDFLNVNIKVTDTVATPIVFDFIFTSPNIESLVVPDQTPDQTLPLTILSQSTIELTKKIKGFTELDIEQVISSAGSSSLDTAIVTAGVSSLLGIPDGTTIDAGTTFQNWLDYFLRRVVHPTYIAPSISGSSNATYEVGTILTNNITNNIITSFNQNDAGPVTRYTIDININGAGYVNVVDSPSIISYSLQNIQVDDLVSILTRVYYADGQIKNNNLGDSDSTGQILAGTVARTISFYGKRYVWWDAPVSNITSTTSTQIRALSFKSFLNNGQQFTINIPTGAGKIEIAFPSSFGPISSVKYVEQGNADYTDLFTNSVVSVEGNNGFSPINYNVYTYTPAIAFSSGATFVVTI